MSQTEPNPRSKTENLKNLVAEFGLPIKRATHTKTRDKVYAKSMEKVIVVETLPEKFEEAITKIKSYRPLMLGIDTKTQLEHNMISVITIAVPNTEIYVFEIYKMFKVYGELPSSLIRLLQSPHIIKIMFDPVRRIEEMAEYNIRFDGFIDVRAIAKLRGYTKTGIDNLTKEIFPKYRFHNHWRKRKLFMQAKWADKISDDMAKYTASRANLAIYIYNVLASQPIMIFERPIEE